MMTKISAYCRNQKVFTLLIEAIVTKNSNNNETYDITHTPHPYFHNGHVIYTVSLYLKYLKFLFNVNMKMYPINFILFFKRAHYGSADIMNILSIYLHLVTTSI